MTVNELADLLIAARGRIDFYWNFYAVMVIAIIGWLVSPKRHLTIPMKALVTVAYVLASAANLMGLSSAYTLADALRKDLLRIAAGSPLSDTRIVLEQHSYLMHQTAATWLHVALGLTVLIAVWSARPGEPEAPAAASSPAPVEQEPSTKKRRRK
jgi:hypothetical protein